MSRPGTSGSSGRGGAGFSVGLGDTASSPPRGGFKRALESVERKVAEHSDDLEGIHRAMGEAGSDVEGLLTKLRNDMLTAIADTRLEMLNRMDEMDLRITRLDKALTEQKGVQGILAQQTKDSHKRILEMGEQLHELNTELMGTPSDDEE